MGIWQRISTWWDKDARAKAELETSMTQAERDIADKDFEARVEDQGLGGKYPGPPADFERDSEPPAR